MTPGDATLRVWEEFSGGLRAFVRRRISREDVADDLLQEIFVRVHSRLDSVKDHASIGAWVYRIARNVVIDFHRGKRPESGLGEIEVCDQSTSNLNATVAQWLSAAVDELPSSYRAAVRLAELERLPQSEVAQRLGLSVSGAKSRIQRGRRLLKNQLLKCCHFEFDSRGNIVAYEANSSCSGCCERDCGF